MTPNEGEVQMLSAWQNGETLSLRLYENDYTPVNTATSASFTQATFTGYAAVTLAAGSWINTPGSPSTGAYPAVSFTSTAAQTKLVYGYYILGVSSGKVYKAERFAAAPLSITKVGDQVQITPAITMGSTVSD